MKRSVYIIFALILFYGCNSNRNNRLPYPVEGSKEIKFHNLVLDTIYFKLEVTSYSGHSGVDNGRLYFMDLFFSYLYLIDIDGEVISRGLGMGRGPSEIPINRPSAAIMGNDDFLILGSSLDFYECRNSDKPKKKDIQILQPLSTSLKDPEAYTSYDEILRMNKDYFFYNIYSEAEQANPITHSKKYFENSHTIMQIDRETGAANVLGSFSDFYVNNHSKVKHFFTTIFDIDRQNNFIFSHQADSLIYIADKKFKPVKAFGFEGTDMDKNYLPSSNDWDDFNAAWLNNITNHGYYYWLEYIDELDMTFRSYQKGASPAADGLQIYHGTTLIADVEVPRYFKVTGYIEPYFISQIIGDEDEESIYFYRFKLE